MVGWAGGVGVGVATGVISSFTASVLLAPASQPARTTSARTRRSTVFWILDFGFWILDAQRAEVQNPKSKIQNPIVSTCARLFPCRAWRVARPWPGPPRRPRAARVTGFAAG